MNVAEFCSWLDARLASLGTPKERLDAMADELGNFFGVKHEEIAIYAYDSEREVLVFLWPSSLKTLGSIPLNAHHCLVAQSAVEKKAMLNNTFVSTPHLFIFEHFLSDKAERVPIQKIMSVPVFDNGLLKGVVQVTRKGVSREDAGPDFSSDNLKDLATIVKVVTRYL